MSDVTFKHDPESAFGLYIERGFLCEPDVFSTAECNHLIKEGHKLPTALDGSFVPTMNVHKINHVFVEAMSKPDVVAVMDRLVHGRANGLHSQFYFTPPFRAGLGCHQDNYFVEASGDGFASAWIALIDITPENGGLYAYIGSHSEGILPIRKVDAKGQDKRQTVYEETVVPERYTAMDIFARQGSVVYIHGHLVHGSHQNRSNTYRYALLNTYIRAKEPFRSGHTAMREEFELIRN